MSGLVLVFDDDLLFAPRVEMVLNAHGYRARFVVDVLDLTEALKAAPVLILVNIGAGRIPWPQMVVLVKD